MIDHAGVNTITVVIMEVPCCGGLVQIVKQAAVKTARKVWVKKVIISIKGEVPEESYK